MYAGGDKLKSTQQAQKLIQCLMFVYVYTMNTVTAITSKCLEGLKLHTQKLDSTRLDFN